MSIKRVGKNSRSSNLCPDEKGTESSVMSEDKECIDGSNLCPDEKGTERTRYHEQPFL